MSFCNNDDCPDVPLFGVRGEYGAELSHCPKCGEELSSQRRPLPGEPASPEPLIQEAPEPAKKAPEGPYRYVASFRDYGPAQLARSRLEHEGFTALVLDEHLISINWLWSLSTHGFKLVVAGAEHGEPEQILAEDQSMLLAGTPEMDQVASPFDECPSCGSEDVRWSRLSRRCKALSLWSPLLLFPAVLLLPFAALFQSTYCRTCGFKWRGLGGRREHGP